MFQFQFVDSMLFGQVPLDSAVNYFFVQRRLSPHPLETMVCTPMQATQQKN